MSTKLGRHLDVGNMFRMMGPIVSSASRLKLLLGTPYKDIPQARDPPSRALM